MINHILCFFNKITKKGYIAELDKIPYLASGKSPVYQPISRDSLNKIIELSVFKIFENTLLKKNREFEIDEKAEELVMKLVSGQASNYGISEREAFEILDTWTDGFIEANPNADLSYFNNVEMILQNRITPEKTYHLIKVSNVRYKLLEFSKFVFSTDNQTKIFAPIVAEWEFEYFEALKENNFKKARWIDIRWTYNYLIAMWQKSPIGDLIEFIMKVAK